MGVGISLSGLASAVANEGGIGVIASSAIGLIEPRLSSDWLEANIRGLQREIRKARERTKGILGVNIMVALSNFADMVKTSIMEGIDIIFAGAGLPLNLPQYLKGNQKTKLVPIVSSGRAAGLITRHWQKKYHYLPDAIVVEGPLAGGHLGFKPEQIADPAYSLETLVLDVIEAIKPFEAHHNKTIPVIAAGGIYSGEDICKFLRLGAAGVQMGTRFVTTHECDAAAAFKQTYVNCSEEDIVIIESPVGLPGRAIRNQFIEDIAKGTKIPITCPYHCIITCDYEKSPYCIALALYNAQKGNMKHGFAFAGKNAHKTKEIVSVKQLVRSLIEEYNVARNQPES